MSDEKYGPQETPFLDFTNSANWFDHNLLPARGNAMKELGYETHRAGVKQALRNVGLNTKAVNHIGRGSGARMAELGGASQDGIRRAGRWNNQSVDMCYLVAVPRDVVRTLGGFHPAGHTFYIKRDLPVPSELQRLVFPEVDEWLRRLEA